MGRLLAQSSTSSEGVSPLAVVLFWTAIIAVIAGQWKTFKKAGEHGWAAIVPIYNAIVLLRIAKMSSGWILSIFVPLLGLIVFWVAVPWRIGEAFGKSEGFRLGMILLPFVFWPILGWSDASSRHYVPASWTEVPPRPDSATPTTR